MPKKTGSGGAEEVQLQIRRHVAVARKGGIESEREEEESGKNRGEN